MTNDDVIKIMQASIKRDGYRKKVIGIILFTIPLLMLALTLADIKSGLFFKVGITTYIVLNILCNVLFTLPGILVLRSGIKKGKAKYNKVYNTYINSPEKILRVYDEVITSNGRIWYMVIIQATDGVLTIYSNMQQYRFVVKFIAGHCVNAVEGKKY